MWSGPWTQWPIHASMYQNVPHEQVDWAQLAKQWIQMQQTPSDRDQSNHGPPVAASSAPPHTVQPAPPSGVSATNNYWSTSWSGGDGAAKNWTATGTIPGLDMGTPPPPAAAPPSVPLLPLPTIAAEGVASKETFDYGHASSSQPMACHSYDYEHGGPEQYEPVPQPYQNNVPYNSYWGVNSGPPPFFLRKDRRDSKEDGRHPMLEEEVPQLDAAKRKTLPAWIREGLEKMERERQKKEERERADAERMARITGRGSDTDDPARSKFDDDSEDEKEVAGSAETRAGSQVGEQRNGSTTLPRPSPSPPLQAKFRTPEERQQELMMKVRRMLTEILLDVTNEEVASVAKEMYQKMLQKAPARQLSSSSALANIASGLGGLTGYGTDSASSSGSSSEEDDSDQELERSIREKKFAFAEWERKMAAVLDAAERRQQAEVLSAQKVTADEVVHSPVQDARSPSLSDKEYEQDSLANQGRSHPDTPSPDNRHSFQRADDDESDHRRGDSDRGSTDSERSQSPQHKKQTSNNRCDEAERKLSSEKSRDKSRKRERSSSPPRRRKSSKSSRSSPKRRSGSRERKKHSRRSRSRSRSPKRSSRRSHSREHKHGRKHSSSSRSRSHSRSRSRERSRRYSRSPKRKSRHHSRSASPSDRRHHRRRSYSSESDGSGKRSSRRYRDR